MLSSRPQIIRALRLIRQFSRLEADGTKIVAKDLQSPISHLSIVLKGGSRYAQTPGVSHILEKFAFQNTEPKSALRFVREIELLGAKVSSFVSKENIVLKAQFIKSDLPYFVEHFGNILSKTKFQQYELSERVAPLAALEVASKEKNPSFIAEEIAHEVAFCTGLGNSTYVQKYCPVTLDEVINYAQQVYTKANIVVVGHNVVPEDLQQLVSKHFSNVKIGQSLSQHKPSTVHTGGARIRKNTNNAITIAIPVIKPTSIYSCLAAHLDGNSSIKWSTGISPLALISNLGVQARAKFYNYGDVGLFTITITGPNSSSVSEGTHAAFKTLKDTVALVSEEEASRAYAKARFAHALAKEDPSQSAVLVANEILSETKISISKVLSSDLKQAASNLLSFSKPILIAVGQVHNLPFPHELF